MTIWLMEPIEGAFTHSGGAEAKRGIGGRGSQGSLQNFWEAQLLQEEAVWIDRVNEHHNIQIKLICQPLKMKSQGHGDLLLMALGCVCVPLLWLG